MNDRVRTLTRTVLGFVVAAVLCFGVAEAMTPPTVCDEPTVLGWCPPYTSSTCDAACFSEYGTFGDCVREGPPSDKWCCLCAAP